MNKILAGVMTGTLLLAASGAQARDVIIGTDVVGLSKDTANLFYQGRVLQNSAFRFGGSSTNTGTSSTLSAELGFRFYFDRYADSVYIQGDILSGPKVTTDARIGIDIRMGNVVIDPYISSSANNYGLNIGFRL